MDKIETYGININLDKLYMASRATTSWPENVGYRTDVFFDMDTGDVWAVDLGENNIKEYSSPSIIKVCGTVKHRSAQWIADKIREAVAYNRD